MLTKESHYAWITFDFVQSLIEKTDSENWWKLKSFNVASAIPKGENFCSDLIRLSALYSKSQNSDECEKDFIVKATIPNETFDVITDEVGFFPREISVYMTILPEVEKLLRSAGFHTRFGPRYVNIFDLYGKLLSNAMLY